MTLVVEDGTGLPNSESYVSEVTFKAYSDARGFNYSTYTDTQIEQACRRGAQFVDSYRFRFSGFRTNRHAQAMEWPRVGAAYNTDTPGRAQMPDLIGHFDEGYHSYGLGYDYVPSNVIPVEVMNAQCEAISRELTSPGYLLPDDSGQGLLKSQSAGMSQQVFFPQQGPFGPKVPVIGILLAPLLISATNSALVGRTVRLR